MLSAFANETQWKTLLYRSPINTLDFNGNETNRTGACEHITVKSEVIFRLGLVSKVRQTAGYSTIDTSVSAVKRCFFFKNRIFPP